MPSLRVGVVGVGHLGYHHARIYASLPDVTLAGVVDTSDERGRKASLDFGVPRYAAVQELLEAGIDAASVAVPTSAHHQVASALLDAGVHVLVEKPITTNLRDAADLVNRASDSGVNLQVGHIERFNGAVIALFDAIRKPRFIECHRLSPYPNRSDDVSVVLDLMIHDLDIVRALDGTAVVSVDAVGVPVFSAQEDIANARLRMRSGCVANLTSSRVSMERMRKIRIFEADAYVSTDYSEQEVMVYRKKSGPLPEGMTPMEMISVEPLAVQHDEPLKLELASFVESVRARRRPVVSGEDGLAALQLAQQIVDRIRQSA
ncbi:MAG: Gfo/Idh/MocA family oxidoreductase [Candidatus Hydrogenedentes bacterium]|nr:Gfo/Idh/MocA family oxidoreductase [Candidatus Hydrogenedentota bacterium]